MPYSKYTNAAVNGHSHQQVLQKLMQAQLNARDFENEL